MRILIVSPKFHPVIGGGETFVLHSAEQLHDNGHKVCMAVEPHPNRITKDYEYQVKEIVGLSDINLDVIKATDGLFMLIQEFKPDVIHVHGYFAQLAVSLANNDIPVVTSIHSTPVWGERIVGGMSGFEQERLFAENILKNTKPRIVTAANDVYEVAAKKIVGNDIPIVVFPYPILDMFYEEGHDAKIFRDRFRLNDSDILITVPSRVIERKGIKEAVNALSLLPSNYYLCLPCASEPQDVEYWQGIKLSKQFKSDSDRILIPNSRILPDQMPLLYAASNIVAMPSYYEGAPVATVEAMASKRTFVGADSQGINGFINDGKNGILVPKRSVTDLAAALERLGKDKQLQKKLGEQASRDVQDLSWKAQLPILVKLYESIMT